MPATRVARDPTPEAWRRNEARLKAERVRKAKLVPRAKPRSPVAPRVKYPSDLPEGSREDYRILNQKVRDWKRYGQSRTVDEMLAAIVIEPKGDIGFVSLWRMYKKQLGAL